MDTSNHRRCLLLALAGLLVSTSARGQIDPSSACDAIDATYILWQKPTTAANTTATAPAHDTSFPGITTSGAYFAQGRQLFKFRNSDGAKLWSWCPPNITNCMSIQGSTTINNFPSPVPMSTPGLHGCTGTPCEHIFFGGADGFLYKLDADTGTSSLFADTRRRVGGTLICSTAPGDALNATPAVVLYSYADATTGSRGRAFRDDVDATLGHVGDDVVIVITADGCGDTTRNRIIAYWAKDLSPKWIFNGDGEVKMDRGSEGCMIDYAAMRLYCGTDLPDEATGQSSLFALDIITGALLWSTNAGAILNRPMLNFNTNRLFVANKAGALMAYDPAGHLGGAAPIWSNAVAVAAAGTFISRSPSVESRAGVWQNRILVLDSGGTLHAVSDAGGSGHLLWDLGAAAGTTFKSLPVVLPGASEAKAFIGRSDGYIQMVNLTDTTPIVQGVVTANSTGPAVTYDPSIDLDFSGNPELVVVSGTTISRMKMPFCLVPPYGNDNCLLGGPGGDSCNRSATNVAYNPCLIDFCDSGQCLIQSSVRTNGWVPDGTPCDDDWTGGPKGTKGLCTSSSLSTPIGFNACTNNSDCWPDHVNNTNNHFCKCPGHPNDLAPCNTPGTGTCTCNSASGVNCNDACVSGVCTHDTYTGCACTNPGDVAACSSGNTCCGSLAFGWPSAPGPTTGCVNLLSDPAHCGDCSNDCNTYYTPGTSCASDSECADLANGSCGFTATTLGCTTDANCTAVLGAGSRCSGSTGGLCYTGRCRYLTQAGTCANGVCADLPACTAPSASDLQNAGIRGVDSLAFSHADTCDAFVTTYRMSNLVPDAACGPACAGDVTCGGGNECTNGFCCPAGKICVTGTCKYANVQSIASGGTVSYFTINADISRMHGIGVLKSGTSAFACFVNDPASAGTAGFSRASGTTYSHSPTSGATIGVANEPFAASEFDRGPVGPAVDTALSTDSNWTTYFGNFVGGTCTDKHICKITGNGSTTNTPVAVGWFNQPCKETLPGDGICLPAGEASPERITAIAFGQLKFSPPNVFHRYLIIAHGTTISFLDLDGGIPTQKDIDLTNGNIYDHTSAGAVARGESTPVSVLNIAIVPYGDLVAEVRGSNGNRFLLNVDAYDQSCRHELVVQRDIRGLHPCAAGGICPPSATCVQGACLPNCGTCPDGTTCTLIGGGTCELPGGGTTPVCCIDNAVPNNFGTSDGRLTLTPDGQLLRFVPSATDDPAADWRVYQLTR
jgi:PQQ-like domain